MKKLRTAIMKGLIVVLMYIFIELSSLLGIWVLGKCSYISYESTILTLHHTDKDNIALFINNQSKFFQLSSTLGWTPKINEQSTHLNKKRNKQIIRTINSQGIRSVREYPLEPPAGKTRILAFGDSFTHGAEVSDDECWTELLSTPQAPVEVLNFGVGGYGTDQAFLRYQEVGQAFNPQIVLIGFMTENIRRHVNVFRKYLSRMFDLPLSKPRYILEAGQLKLLKNPLSTVEHYKKLLAHEQQVMARMGQHDYFYSQAVLPGRFDAAPSVRFGKIFFYNVFKNKSDQATYYGMDSSTVRVTVPKNDAAIFYDTNTEAFQVTVEILDQFYRQVKANHVMPVIVIFPNRDDLQRYRTNPTKKKKKHLPLVKALQSRGLEYIDLMDAFEQSGDSYEMTDLFAKSHYSPLGNQIVAKWLLKYLEEHEMLAQ